MRLIALVSCFLLATATGCSVSLQTAGALPQLAPAAGVAGDVKITGTYDGTLKETEGSHSRSGTCEITLTQTGKSIKGTAEVHFDSGKSYDFTIDGSVKSRSKKRAALSITIIADKGSSAKGTATITGKTLRGKASASGKNGTAYVTFTAKRKQK
jgi:hypothetical protein